ncbi:MAG TPA: arylsulfatase [Candidatus Saccharimonadales bacterium]|nr:arylsulfatase [Candidatus Saccharimonadales bacterium]
MMHSQARAVCFAAVLLLVGLCAGESAEPPASRLRPRPPRPPNIVFILADDLGYGELGCYGQERIRTPNLDRLAAEGMRFTRCYAGTTVCAPSRASLMTGLHTGHVSIRGNADLPLLTNEVTVAQVLQSAGYETACIGKWGLGKEHTVSTPSRKGFDEWFGYLDQTLAHDYYPTTLWRSSRIGGVEDRVIALAGNAGGAKQEYSHDFFTRAATNFIRSARSHPFFLYLAYTIPHAHNELKDAGMEVPSDAPYSNENWPQPEKNKAAMIARMDRDIGVLLSQLQRLGLEENTVVFFSSDNGPHREGGVRPEFFKSAGPLRGIKRDLYEGGIRVPMIARWRGRIPAGATNEQVWAFWDFLPTAAEIAGTTPPAGLDGVSMLPTLLGQPQTNQHDYLYWEFHEKGSSQAVLMGDWKAVRLGPDQPLELYNLKSDPGEKDNVAPAHADIVERISAYLKTARTESAHWPLQTAAQQAEASRPNNAPAPAK